MSKAGSVTRSLLVRRVAAAAAFAGAWLLASPAVADTAPSPPASEVTTFGVQPADASGPDDRPAFTYGMTPGAAARDRVAALNFSTEPLKVSVYPADSLPTEDGGFTLADAAEAPVGVGAWITLDSPREITIPPRSARGPGQVIIPMRVKVPVDAEPGDHAGGIVVSLKSAPSTGEGPSVVLDQRVASRVYIRVSGDARPELAIEGLSASADAALYPFRPVTAVVTYTVRNTGNVALDYEAAASVSGLFGSWSQTAEETGDGRGFPQLLPGSSAQVTVSIDGVVPQFLMRATAEVTPITPGPTGERLAPVTASTSLLAVPWLLVALLVGLALAIWWRLRSGRQGDEAPAELAEPAAAGK